MAICTVCHTQKRKSEFYNNHSQCKICYRAKVKKYQKENKEKIKEYEKQRANLPHRVKARKEYAQTEAGKRARARGSAAWKRRNPIKIRAQQAVNSALRTGELIRPDVCENACLPSNGPIHGHHGDYSKPLKVNWLCQTCHIKWHKINGEGKTA